MDAKRFPLVAAYLARLPHGVDSYASCRAKATVYVDALASRPLAPPPGSLPEPVARLIEERASFNEWIPEVCQNSILLAIADTHFPGRTDDFEEWVYARNQRLFAKPLYRVLFWVLSPDRLLSGAEQRWSAFRRGTKLSVARAGDKRATLKVTHPPYLLETHAHRGLGAAFRAAVEAAGGDRAAIEIVQATDDHVRYALSWH